MSTKWPTVPLGEVLTEREETPLQKDLVSGRIKIISKISFQSGQIQIRPDGETKTGMILARPGDLVVSGINAAKGAIAIYGHENKEPVAATIHYGAYVPDSSRTSTKFLWWLLRSRFFRDLLSAYLPGGIKTELKAKRLLAIPIPLPPLEEQRRIVAWIGELASQVYEAIDLRQQAEEEAEILVDSHFRAVFDALEVQHGKTKLDSLIVDAGYGSSYKCYSERTQGMVPVLRIPNVASEKVSLDNLKYTHLSVSDRDRLFLKSGDILVVRTNGSINLVGRSAVVEELPEPTAFASYIIRLRFDTSRIFPAYGQKILRHLRVSGQLINLARTTAGQYNVSLGRLRSAEIPVPFFSTQQQIVYELDTFYTQIEALKQVQSKTAAELDALLPSILDRAFKGEL